MIRNRDINRKNRANLAVQACLYSKLNTSSLTKLKEVLTVENSSNPDAVNRLISVAEATSKSMVDLFTSSQNEISKRACLSYANEQFSQIRNGYANGESMESNESVSKHIVTPEILQMYKTMEENVSDGKYSIF